MEPRTTSGRGCGTCPVPEKPLVPVAQLANILEEFGDGALESIEGQGMLRIMNVAEAKAVELAPEDTGNLAGSSVVRVSRRGRNILGLLRFTASYAATAHELPEHARGPRTRQKPGNEFGPAGPKYVERVIAGFTNRLARDVGEFLQEVWGRARVRRRRR